MRCGMWRCVAICGSVAECGARDQARGSVQIRVRDRFKSGTTSCWSNPDRIGCHKPTCQGDKPEAMHAPETSSSASSRTGIQRTFNRSVCPKWAVRRIGELPSGLVHDCGRITRPDVQRIHHQQALTGSSALSGHRISSWRRNSTAADLGLKRASETIKCSEDMYSTCPIQ
jgi:hypothetical protein